MNHKKINMFFVTVFLLISAVTHCSGYTNEKKCVVITFYNKVGVVIRADFKPDACNHQIGGLGLMPGDKKSISLSAGSTISVMGLVPFTSTPPKPTVFKASQSNAQVTCDGEARSPRCRYDDNKVQNKKK